jgi:hypothetical protein
MRKHHDNENVVWTRSKIYIQYGNLYGTPLKVDCMLKNADLKG